MPPTQVLLNSAETKAHDGISNYGVGTLKVIVNKWRGELFFWTKFEIEAGFGPAGQFRAD